MTEEELVKTIGWLTNARSAISRAHGVPDDVIYMFPIQLLKILISNDLRLVYMPEKLSEKK